MARKEKMSEERRKLIQSLIQDDISKMYSRYDKK